MLRQSSSNPEKSAADVRDDADRERVSGLALARRLWRGYLSRYWGMIAAALAAMALYAGSASAIPIGVEWINQQLARIGDGGDLSRDLNDVPVGVIGPLIILVLGAVNAVSQYAQTRLSATAALKTLRDLQADVFQKLVTVDDAQLRRIGGGQAAARLTNDAMVLRETLTRAAAAVRDLLTLIGLCAVMIWYDWALFLVVLIVYPVIGWPVGRIGKFLRRSSREAQDSAGDIAGLGVEAVTGGRLIRAYGLEERQQAKARDAFDDRLGVLLRMANLRSLNEPFIFMVGAIALAIVVAVVAARINAGALNIAQFISFIIALLLMSQPARGLSTLNAVAQEGFGAFERLLGVIDLTPQITEAVDATPLKIAQGAITFDEVRFAYEDERSALNGFSLDIKGGERIAIVGESGTGKSTLFNLLLRFYEPQAGRIVIDGQPIKNATLSSLRASIAVVSQETVLFDESVADNIVHGRLDADRDMIRNAAERAAAHGFIETLPDQYETRVGEGGLSLSGGQRQRLALARAFLKDAPILLLDEATAALDAQTEHKIEKAVDELSRGRTTIIIAHRLSTVRRADRIIVMDKGRVIEIGDHETLIAKGGAYKRLAVLQFSDA